MKNLHILLLTLALLLTVAASAQPAFRLVDTTDGLPDNEVKTMLYVPDGRLCIRTSSSLSLFDGCSFTAFTPFPGDACPTGYVASLSTAYTDALQRVWIKESGRLLVFDLTTERFVSQVPQLLRRMGVNSRLNNIFIDSAKDYWLVTQSGCLLWIKAKTLKGDTTYTCRRVNVSTRGLRDVCRMGSSLWLVYGNGQCQAVSLPGMKVTARQQLWQGSVLQRDFVSFAGSAGHLWLMWNHGVAKLDVKTKRWVRKYANPDATLVSIGAAPQGTAWVSIRKGGLVCIDANGHTQHMADIATTDGNTLHDDINSVLLNGHNVVLGLYAKGLCLYSPNMRAFPFVSFQSLGLPQPESYRMGRGRGGECLFTFSNTCYSYNPLSQTMTTVFTQPGESEFISCFRDSRNRLWVGTFRHGAYLKTASATEHFLWGEIPSRDVNFNIVRGFAEDRGGNVYVSYHGGIGRFDEQRRRVVPIGGKAFDNAKVVNDMAFDIGGLLWAATSNGLIVYSPRLKKTFMPADIVGDRSVAAALSNPCKTILTLSDGTVCVGTLNGLFIVNPLSHTATRWGRADGMPNEMIQSTVADASGNIWAATAHGLCCLSHGLSGTTSLTVYDEENRLGDSKFLPIAAAAVGDGRLLFGCATGFYVVSPADVKAMTYSGHPVLTGLTVNNRDILPGHDYDGRILLPEALGHVGKVTLHHNENFITLRFSGLNFDMPAHTSYRYRLRGMTDDWTVISPADGMGTATFTSLSPGRYTFEVYSAAFPGQWNSHPTVLTIIVKSPLWATWWARLIYLLAIVAIVLMALKWKMNRDREKLEQEKSRELEEMKYRFFTNISHEFRTLLTLIITPIGSLLRRTTDPEERRELGAVSKNAGDLLQLVNQLLDFRKMEMNGEQLHLTGGNLDEFVSYTALKFNPLAGQKGVSLKVDDHSGGIFMYYDHDKVGKILTNLLSNAFKYTPRGGSVTVTLEKTMNANRRYALITVSDTGCGIAPDEQKKIFDRFYRSDRQNGTHVGSGIGLNLVREYVTLHGGTVSVSSQPGHGSQFTVSLPCDLKPATAPSDSGGVGEKPATDTATATTANVQTVQKTVLVVEDNDDFRSFLVSELRRHYATVIEANDGVSGALMAEEQEPDIVVSDVMMPRMSGTDLCRRIKENIATSHIPVVLLTAWSTAEGEAEGYKAGADAYIAKPFDMDVLLVRIANLLERQQKRRDDFSHSPSLDAKALTDSTADSELLQKIIGLIEQHIDDTDYTIDTLARDVLMSRMSFYRKMKALTGETPADFIRTVRLKQAAKLLREGRMNVSEVCYATGFNSPQNFSRHFREMFGVLPSQYRQD